MDKKTLLIFAHRILKSSSENKAALSLNQLKNILDQQCAERSLIVLLNKIIYSIPEMQEASRRSSLTEQDIDIAERRAKERKKREAAAMRNSRC